MKRHLLLAMILVNAAGQMQAMPTKAELNKMSSVVQELMRPLNEEMKSGKKTRSEVADAAMEFVDQAKSEGAKYLLIKGAYGFYVRDGKYDAALDSLKKLQESVSGIPAQGLVSIIESPLRNVSRKDAAQLYALLDDQKAIARSETELKRLAEELKRDPRNRALNTNAAEHYAVVGNWEAALKCFALGDNKKAVEAAKAEQKGSQSKALADFWWSYPQPTQKDLVKIFRRHAAEIYAKALAAGTITGLYKAQVEQRIVEMSDAPVAEDPPASASASSGSKSRTEASVKTSSKGGLYCVVDLSDGPNAKNYPVSYLKDVPKEGWTDEYKTTKLVLRKIETDKNVMADQVFYIGSFEVTQRQWELVTGSNPSRFRGPVLPVEQVLLHDCQAFINRLNEVCKKVQFRLPNEQEWEYCCRAGGFGDWGKKANGDEGPLDEMGWYNENCGGRTHPVGRKEPNAWGLYDMHGNVHELTSIVDGENCIIRGGSWSGGPAYCRMGFRGTSHVDRRRSNLGFRLAAQCE